MANTLSPDTITSALFDHARTWTPGLIPSHARDVLKYLVFRLYSVGNGDLHTASLTISQSAIADHFGLSREWCNKLLGSLKATGWITYSSGRREGGVRTTCTYGIGNMLKRLLARLIASHKKKSRATSHVKSGSQVFPLFLTKKSSFFHPDLEDGKNGYGTGFLQRFCAAHERWKGVGT